MNHLSSAIIERTKISSGSCFLIDSQLAFLYDSNQPVEIEEEFGSDFRIIIRIVLAHDDKNEYRIEVGIQEDTVTYTCYNFDNALGTGTRTPIEFATYNGKKLFLHFWIYTMGGKEDAIHKVEYSIWMEK